MRDSKAVAGGRIGDIGHAIESYCVSRGYGISGSIRVTESGSLHEDLRTHYVLRQEQGFFRV